MRTISKAMSCLVGVSVAAFAVACVATAAPAAANDPASVEAPTAAAPEGASALASTSEPAASTHEHGAATAEPTHDHAAPASSGSEHTGHDHAAHPGIMYTCPMHPEVMEKEAGKCPKCGMNLEPVKPEGK